MKLRLHVNSHCFSPLFFSPSFQLLLDKHAEFDEAEGRLRVVTKGMARLSSDARLISEDTAAQFLEEFTKCMSDPQGMLE